MEWSFPEGDYSREALLYKKYIIGEYWESHRVASNHRTTPTASELKKAHVIQYELIQEEARGNHIETNVLLVHAQDHLSMAIFMENYVDQIINLYKEISIMKGRYQHENFVSM